MRRSAALATLGGVMAIGLAGCGSTGAAPPGTGDASLDGSTGAGGDAGETTDGAGSPDAGDAGPRRSFALASGGVQLLVTGPTLGLQITPANLADDDDAIEIHQEFYGIPWAAFEAGTPPPAEWTAQMDALAASAKAAAKPVFLSVTMLDGGRDHLAAETVIDSGQVKTQDDWSASCYDFATAADAATVEQGYLRYVAWMIDEFSPRWLNVAVEVNLFFEKCPAAIGGLIGVANAAYDTAKAKSPSLVVFPSFQIDHLYGYSTDSCPNAAQRTACFDSAYAQIAPLKRDRFAMSTYPMLGAFSGPADVPVDWFTRGSSRGGERPLIAETGWDSTPIVVQSATAGCATLFQGTEADETAYLGRVLDAAKAANMDLVNWWSDRDLVVSQLMTSCPCSFDSTWCTVLGIFRGPPSDGGTDTQAFGELSLKAFGTMGLRGYDGTPKSTIYPVWSAARAVPLATP
jgi:hypothetical protein